MNVPLVMSAAPLNEKKTLNTDQSKFINTNSMLPKPLNNNDKSKQEGIKDLKSLIQKIHNNSEEDSDNSLYNSLTDYESENQKSKKIEFPIENNLKKVSDTNKAYVNINSDESYPKYDKDEMMQKINYIIHTLDKQKDIKSDQKLEELLLYSFLGIFIIYVLDSFTKIGKYKR